MTKPISYNLHDYQEIASLYGYQVKLTLKDQQTLESKAIDTRTTPDKRENLVVGEKQIELNQLEKLEVLTANAQFREVVF